MHAKCYGETVNCLQGVAAKMDRLDYGTNRIKTRFGDTLSECSLRISSGLSFLKHVRLRSDEREINTRIPTVDLSRWFDHRDLGSARLSLFRAVEYSSNVSVQINRLTNASPNNKTHPNCGGAFFSLYQVTRRSSVTLDVGVDSVQRRFRRIPSVDKSVRRVTLACAVAGFRITS